MKKLDKKNIQDILALTPLQEGMLFHYLKDPENDYYFEQLILLLSGEIDIQLFERAWNFIVRVNEMLRAVFRWERVKNPFQIILKKYHIQPAYYDLSGINEHQRKKRLEEIKRKDREKKFDLKKVPFRITLCKIEKDKYAMIISNHHILYDGWSNGIILKEFFAAYNDFFNGRVLIKPVKSKFKEFVKWCQHLNGSSGKDKPETFWKDYLKDFDSPTGLPIKSSGREKRSAGEEKYRVRLEKEKVEGFVKKQKVTLASFMYGAWGLLLQKYKNNRDVIFGTTAAGRSVKIPGIEDMVGLFINTLPLRTQGHSHERLNDFLYRIEKALQSRQAYEATPLVDIKKYSEGGRRGELFDTIMAVENYPLDRRLMLENSILSVDSYQMHEHTHYDLTVSITVFEDIHCMFTYCRDKLDEEAIVRLSGHFRTLVENMITNPHKEISELEILSRQEKEKILYTFNHTDAEYPRHKTVHQLFAEQALRTPDGIAIHTSYRTYMTYEELNRKSNQLACLLQAKGVKPGSIVGIMVERSLEMVTGILGILKAGGAYLPIDPAYPQKRIEYILKDSGAGVLLTNLPEAPLHHSSFIEIPNHSDLAYVIYTSGSTGKPKGVMVEHQSVVNLLFVLHRAYPLMERDTYLLKTAYVFDVSVTELFGWFLAGGKLAILEKDGEKDPRKILDTIERVGVTHINFVPSMFNMFIETCESNPQQLNKLAGLKYIFLAGEVLLPELINRFRRLVPHAAVTVENIYGPTEAAVYTSRYSLSQWKDCGFVPIGKPLENMKLYVLDKDDHLQPIGVPGECCIAGVGVARGYLNNPEMTNSKFQITNYKAPAGHPIKIPNSPTHPLTHSPIYKTGDQVRWLPDGNIEFLGRIDQQVKIRGFRVELGEIENQLLNHPNIREAVVVAKENDTGDKYLCAYIVAGSMEHGAWKNTARLREYLAQRLPDYMIPTYFVSLDRLPLTPSGKIDRKALPEPEVEAGAQAIAPRNQREEALAAIWSDVLGIDKEIGIDDHFFRLGGHSLKLIALISRIHKKFNIEIPLAQVFKNPTIREISNVIVKSAEHTYRAIEPSEQKEYYPLSSAQKRLFLFQQGNKDSMVYNMPGIMVLEGEVRKDRLEEILKRLINRHESFRTSFETIAGEPVQRIHPQVEFQIENLSFIPQFVRPFDLSCAPLLRVGLIKIAEQQRLLLDMHHIVSDGMSVKVLLREFTALAAGEELPPLKLRYKDYAQWQQKKKIEDWMIKQGEYWEEEFLAVGKAPALELPVDFTKPKDRGFEGKQVRFQIAGEEARRLKALALEQETTLYVLLFTIYYVFLSKITGQEAVVAGTAAAGRRHADLESIIGMFVNTLVLTAYPGSRQVFTRFLKEVKEKAWQAFENQDYPFEGPLEPATLFALQDMNIDEMELQVPGNTSKFDLMLLAEEAGEDLVFTFEYRSRLFKDTTIRRFIRYFKRIAEAVVERPAIELLKIEIISKEEKNRILYEFNDTTVDYPRDKTIHQLFEEQVSRAPARIAIHRTYSTYMTYEELNRKANQLACQLQAKGVKSNSIVGIMEERSIEMVVGILGILKAGGAYLPIDPGYPEERITYMLRDSGAEVLLKNSSNSQLSMINPATRNPQPATRLAYVIYTSGSTGRPKGVMVEHRNVVRLVKNTNYITFREGDRLLQTGALGFDASTFEIWGALLNGLTLYLADRDTILTPEKLKKTITDNNITTMWMTSPLFNRMVQADIEIFSGLTNLLVGGDVLSPLHINRLKKRFPQLKVINGYGPTENTTFSTTFLIEEETIEKIPIGKPIANSTVHIVDKSGQLQPIGIAGELWVGGDGVSRGYLNNPDLTNSKFQALAGHPLSFSASQLLRFSLYRTGDLARWLPDGNIEFLGRRDQQVKIRGFRIEPREIERCLLEHEFVKEAVVLPTKDAGGDKYLCAYIVPHSPHSPKSELREYLSRVLPDYMIPSYFISLEEIPLTPNGKVDWQSLPEPGTAGSAGRYAAPRDETERKLVEIWKDVLSPGDSLFGIDDDFFQLGGHSIKATLLASKIHKTFHVNVSLTDIFTRPTVRGLAAYIKEAAKEKYIAIPSAEIKDHYALSSAQKRLYVLQQMNDQGIGYNIPSLFQVEGAVDKQRLENIFKQLIKRHESLRTSFFMKEEEPVQKIHKDVDFEIEFYPSPPQAIRPFDLSQAPLLRVGLIKTGDNLYLLMLDMHHIISDGVSMGILVRDFISLYKGEPLPTLQVQYKDYAEWQHGETFKEMIKSREGYWLKEFAGEIPVLNLPFDYVRPAVQSFEGRTGSFAVDGESYDALKRPAMEEGATLFMVLLTVFTIFLSKLSGQEDIVIGTPAAGRGRTDLQQIIGMFVNTLPLRNFPGGEKTFREFLREIKERVLEAFENQDYPYEDLVEAVSVNRDTGRNPLFDAAFALQGPEISDTGAMDQIELPGLKLKFQEFETNISKFDLTLFVIQSEAELAFRMEYCTKLFKEESIERFTGYFKRVVSSVVDNPGIKIGQIEIISEVEKRQVLFDFNQVEAEGYPYPTNKTLHGLFEEQVERTPDCIAVVGPTGKHLTNRTYRTYKELNHTSNQLACLLQEKGVQPGSIVGIVMERSIEMIIGILGILKAGAAYLPINPKTPPLRRGYMMADSGVTVWLSRDMEGIQLNYRISPTHLTHLTHPTHLSYIIYTSGSTGEPKGVALTHANVCPLLHWCFRQLGIGPGERVVQNLPFYFDWSVWEIFITLTTGASLYSVPDDSLLDPNDCIAFIRTKGITVLHTTPTQYRYLVNTGQKTETLNYLLFGGEKLTLDLVERSFQLVGKGCRLFNVYGPTETAIASNILEIKPAHCETFKQLLSVPIGKPMANAGLLVLDKDGNLCPVNIPGELYIAGDGVSPGYLNNPEMTNEKFTNYKLQITNKEVPFGPILNASGEAPAGRPLSFSASQLLSFSLYRTGDLVRWLGDGTMEFLGRIDFQVKIRGLRIELGEIENRLLAHERVKEVVVIDRAKGPEKYLCAYIVGTFDPAPGHETLKQYLAQQLPQYMIPSYFVFLKNLPLNPNGKVDRKALPAPDFESAADVAAPTNTIEKRLLEIWSQVLERREHTSISIDDNFFRLGGHSLSAALLVSKIHKAFDVKVPLAEIFQTPTIRELAAYIENAAAHRYVSIERVEKKEYYPLSSAQKRLYLLYRMDPQSTGYNMPVVTTLQGRVEEGKLEEVFKQLILRHESLRTSFHMVNEEPVQKVHDNVEFEIEYDDAAKPRVEVFDLSCTPLLRVGLIKTGERKHLLVVDMHHIISDGLSISLLVKEFAALLKGVVLPEPGVTYKDYAQWQNSQLDTGSIKEQETYWLKEFTDEIPVLNLPTDFPRPAVQNLEGGGLHFETSEKETGQLKRMASEQDVTLFMVLLTLLNILLSRLSSQEDIVVGFPAAGRVSVELEQVIGMFVNILALRNYPAGQKTFRQCLQEVRNKTLAAFENQEYQFEKLVDQLPVNRDTGRSPLFDVVLDVQGQNDYLKELDTEIDGLKLKPYPYHSGISKFDLVFHCEEVENKLLFTVDYAVGLFKEETVKRFITYFKKIVSHVINNRDIRVGEIDLLSEEEKRKILNDLNGMEVAYAAVKPIHQLFAEQVRRAPDGIAIHLSYRTHRTYMTYDQLNRKAAQLALLLQKKGVKPDSIAGIMMEPSLEMIISILAVLKAGGAYLPIDPTYPTERIRFMLDDGTAKVLLTKTGVMEDHSFTAFQGLSFDQQDDLVITAPRSQIRDLDALHPVDRTSVNYEKYNRCIGQAMVKNAISLQATRGCPYHCAYCHKIWPGKHVYRSAENVFDEVRQYYRMGIRRFVFIDDIFNINSENSRRFFQLIINNGLEVQLFFPNGLRGDLLTRDYIDLMVKAGTVNAALALETASPRLQKLLGKHLDLDKLAENLQYLCQQYPHVILELFIMHGFPTETEAEALQTLEFVKRFKWIHFPYFHILKIYPSTDMAAIAGEHGIPDKAIAQSENLAFHQLPETLPFDKRFTRQCQADFFNRYFMLKERLLQVLPYQMKTLTEDEMVQKYNSYLPVEVKSLQDLMEFAGIKEEELEFRDFPAEVPVRLPAPSAAVAVPDSGALNVLLLDLSQFFSKDKEKRDMLYDVVEPPLGLMYLLTALKKEFGSKVNGRIAKSRIDFDNYEELKQLLEAFKPNLIGLRTLSYYKDFFHRTAAMIRHWGIDAAVIAGGPYATGDYVSLLKDRNIDLAVLGEGELTLCEIAAKMLENEGKLPGEDALKDIPGIAFAPGNNSFAREIIMMDDVLSGPEGEKEPAEREETAGDIAYVIYTSGTTGKPKGVLVEHGNIASLMKTGKELFDYHSRDVWTMFHSFCFDFSVWEMYGALLYGGKLVLISRMMARDHQLYLDTLKKENVTILNQTPTVFYRLLEEEMKCSSHELRLRYVIFGGEALKPGKLKPWQEKYPGTRLINMYGITETTVHVTFKEITSKEIDSNISNIGKPLPSLSGYIMNKYLRLQPRNVAGELTVGGQGVARGYLNRPELTAERFNISYKTGDLVRLNGAGEMEYLGRIDHQVKIRGNRVELGEIERQMMQLEEIGEVLVMTRKDEKDDHYLCAYMKPVPGHEVNITQLREALATRLPVYMIPSYFIPLEAFPVTSTGKVARGKLPLPEGIRPMLGAAYEAPQTGTARTTADIWQDILKLEKVGIHDNFFDLGGNSLDIVRLNARLKETFDIDIPLVTLFEYPTIHTFTRYLQTRAGLDTPTEEKAPDFSDKLKKGRDKMKGRRQRMR